MCQEAKSILQKLIAKSQKPDFLTKKTKGFSLNKYCLRRRQNIVLGPSCFNTYLAFAIKKPWHETNGPTVELAFEKL